MVKSEGSKDGNSDAVIIDANHLFLTRDNPGTSKTEPRRQIPAVAND